MKIKALGVVAGAVILAAGYLVLNSTGDSGMYRPQPARPAPATGATYGQQVKPTSDDGRWLYLTSAWSGGGPADSIYIAGRRQPGGGAQPAGSSPVRVSIQVDRGDKITLTVRAHSGHGEAACWIQRLGESYQGVPLGAKADNGKADNGTVTCTRVVDW